MQRIARQKDLIFRQVGHYQFITGRWQAGRQKNQSAGRGCTASVAGETRLNQGCILARKRAASSTSTFQRKLCRSTSMEKKARKFSTAADEKNYAYCPFKISKLVEAPGDAPKHHAGIELQAIQGCMQISPFSPQGRFQTGQSMNLLYFVQPRKAWFSMTRYNSAVRKSSHLRMHIAMLEQFNM